MPRNNSGVYSLPAGYLAVTGQTITASQHNTPLEDIAADLNVLYAATNGTTSSLGQRLSDVAGIRPDDFSGTDQQKWDACIAAAIADGQRVLVDRPLSLTAHTDITSLGNGQMIDISCGPAGLLDYSGCAAWAAGSTSGLLRIAGSAASGVSLAVRAQRQYRSFRVTSATRSGTTATFVTREPHGLQPGDPIHVSGGVPSSPAGDRVFFSYLIAISSATVGQPFVVATVPDAVTFTCTVADTGNTTLGTTAFVRFASDVLILPSLTGFAAGQRVLLGSDRTRTSGDSEANRIGEIVHIADTFPAINALWLHSELRETYALADSPVVRPLVMPRARLSGINIKGKGPNLATPTSGDRGIVCEYVDSPHVKQARVRAVDQMGIQARSCLGGQITSCDVEFDASDEGGRVSGDLDIQYGICFGMACDGLVIDANRVVGGRHAIVQDGTSVTTYQGVTQHIAVTNNVLLGQWLGAISTHQGVGRMIVSDNHIYGAQDGINIRFNDETILANNHVEAARYAVHLYNDVGNLTSEGGVYIGGQNALALTSIQSAGSWRGTLAISGGYWFGGDAPIIVQPSTKATAARVQWSGMTIEGATRTAIRLDAGPLSGRITDMTIRGSDEIPTGGRASAAIWITNPVDLKVEDVDVDHNGAAFTRLVFTDGASAARVTARGVRNVGGLTASVADVDLSTGSGHVTTY